MAIRAKSGEVSGTKRGKHGGKPHRICCELAVRWSRRSGLVAGLLPSSFPHNLLVVHLVCRMAR